MRGGSMWYNELACHVERSETSPRFQSMRFFASLRMTNSVEYNFGVESVRRNGILIELQKLPT
jgi:hypothetical protein